MQIKCRDWGTWIPTTEDACIAMALEGMGREDLLYILVGHCSEDNDPPTIPPLVVSRMTGTELFKEFRPSYQACSRRKEHSLAT